MVLLQDREIDGHRDRLNAYTTYLGYTLEDLGPCISSQEITIRGEVYTNRVEWMIVTV
jgi:hypothetical protein